MGKVSRSTQIKCWARQAFVQRMSQNLESMYGLGFCYSMIPALREAYGDDEEGLKEAMHRSMTTFITEPYYGAAINGMAVAMEEEKSNGADIPGELITDTRLSLMGPFAGFGDSFHWGTIRPLVRAMFIPMATSGIIFGIFGDWIIWISAIVISWFTYWLGYKYGRNSILSILQSNAIKQITAAAGVVGMFMMGAMSAQYVTFSTALTLGSGDGAIALQSVLDSVLPGFLPALLILLTFIYLNKKGKFATLILVYVAVGILGSLLGIL